MQQNYGLISEGMGLLHQSSMWRLKSSIFLGVCSEARTPEQGIWVIRYPTRIRDRRAHQETEYPKIGILHNLKKLQFTLRTQRWEIACISSWGETHAHSECLEIHLAMTWGQLKAWLETDRESTIKFKQSDFKTQHSQYPSRKWPIS